MSAQPGLLAVLDPASDLAIRVVGCLLFAIASIGAFRDQAGFREILRAYRLLPGSLVAPVARALPSAEIWVAILLPLNLLRPWPNLAAAGLLTVFAGAMAVNLVRGRAQIACGCSMGHGGGTTLGWGLVVRNLAIAALLVCGPMTPGIAPIEVFSGVLAGVSGFLVLQAANALWALPALRQHRRAS